MKRLAVVLVVVGMLVVGAQAQAVVLWGVVVMPSPNRLVTFDSASPQTATVIGELGPAVDAAFVSGLDFDAAGNLYATNHASSDFLFGVDKTTGTATLIGGSGLRQGSQLTDLSWDSANNRMLALGATGASPDLYEVDLLTGALTLVGSITDISDGFEVSLATDADGTVFIHGVATDRWYRIDAGLNATALNLLPFSTNFGQGGCIDLGGDGTLYHAAFNDGTSHGELWTIDKSNGDATFVGPIASNLGDAVQITDAAIQHDLIPEPCTVALLGLGALSLFGRRRRH